MDLDKAHRLANELLATHGLDRWTVEFDNAKRRAGVCRQDRLVIGLSAPLTRLHPEIEVRDTVLHEIAHALVGGAHGHDAVWRRTALAIGSTAKRCVPAEAPRVAAPWVGVCAKGHTNQRHRRPERVASCTPCHEQFSLDHLLEWTYLGRPASMHPNYEAELQLLRQGRPSERLPVGAHAVITVPGT